MSGNWKETLFVWQGDLHKSADKIVWRGTWVGTEDIVNDFPSNNDFIESANHFELHFPAPELDFTEEGMIESTINVEWLGSYLLDNGNGHESNEDIKHSCCFLRLPLLHCKPHERVDPLESDLSVRMGKSGKSQSECSRGKWYYVVARGETEFGDFFSKGLLRPSLLLHPTTTSTPAEEEDKQQQEQREEEEEERPSPLTPLGTTLTLVRRYLSKRDARARRQVPLQEVGAHMGSYECAQMEEEEGVENQVVSSFQLVKPWQHLPLTVKATRKREAAATEGVRRVGAGRRR